VDYENLVEIVFLVKQLNLFANVYKLREVCN